MNKLRINPRGNNAHQSKSSENKTDTTKDLQEDIDEELHYFLNKSANEFTMDDIQNFQNANQRHTDLFIDNSRNIINKLFAISKILVEKNNEVKEDLIKDDIFETLSSLPKSFIELNSLITEVVEDNNEDNMSFLTILIDELINVDKELKKDEVRIDNLYNALSEMLYKLQFFNIIQQKYIYRAIAKAINKKTPNYNLISPEDGNFVDPKYHKNISGNGQRITRGLTYILLDTANEEVLKFGNVKTI